MYSQSFAEVDNALRTNEEPIEDEIVTSILNTNDDDSEVAVEQSE